MAIEQPSGEKDFPLRISGHRTVLQGVKTAINKLVGRIIHKAVKFSIPGRKRSSLYEGEGEGEGEGEREGEGEGEGRGGEGRGGARARVRTRVW